MIVNVPRNLRSEHDCVSLVSILMFVVKMDKVFEWPTMRMLAVLIKRACLVLSQRLPFILLETNGQQAILHQIPYK